MSKRNKNRTQPLVHPQRAKDIKRFLEKVEAAQKEFGLSIDCPNRCGALAVFDDRVVKMPEGYDYIATYDPSSDDMPNHKLVPEISEWLPEDA